MRELLNSPFDKMDPTGSILSTRTPLPLASSTQFGIAAKRSRTRTVGARSGGACAAMEGKLGKQRAAYSRLPGLKFFSCPDFSAYFQQNHSQQMAAQAPPWKASRESSVPHILDCLGSNIFPALIFPLISSRIIPNRWRRRRRRYGGFPSVF